MHRFLAAYAFARSDASMACSDMACYVYGMCTPGVYVIGASR